VGWKTRGKVEVMGIGYRRCWSATLIGYCKLTYDVNMRKNIFHVVLCFLQTKKQVYGAAAFFVALAFFILLFTPASIEVEKHKKYMQN
jgi:hypothetical protein